MKKQAYQLFFLLLVSVTSYAQKKGKLALPQLEKTANSAPWANGKTKQHIWLEQLNKKNDTTTGISIVIINRKEPAEINKKKS